MKKPLLIGGIILLLLVIVAGIAWWHFHKPAPTTTTVPTPPPKTVTEPFTGNRTEGVARTSMLALKGNKDPEFFALKDKVNATVLAGLRPADKQSRKETYVTTPVALRGTVVTPDQIIQDGLILIEYGRANLGKSFENHVTGTIKKVATFAATLVATGTLLVDLSGYAIYPGFLDTHNHIGYGIFDLWIPTYDVYRSRDDWSDDPRYKDWKKANFYFSKKYKKMTQEATKYGEIRALIGGGTMTQGFDGGFLGSYGLLRNAENRGNMLGMDNISQSVLPINQWWSGKRAAANREKVIDSFTSKGIQRYIIHLSEGIDDRIHEEFVKMRDLNMLRKEFVGIHCTALEGKDWSDFAKAGMKVVWSPLSNLILYNKTTDIAGALDQGVPLRNIAFGPDWGPSGSPNMLFEAKIVAEYNKEKMNNRLSPKQILEMMTTSPAIVTGYEQFIGRIKEGLRADLTVVKLTGDDPYQSVLDAPIEAVTLVMIDGQPLYGTLEFYKKFPKGNDYEIFPVNGVDKAIDITDEMVPEGKQTFRELLTMLNDGFADIKKNIPFEFLSDVEDYCQLASLYWPRPTSYKNIMFISMMGRDSDSKDHSGFKASDFHKTRNAHANEQFKALKSSPKDAEDDE